MPATMIVPMLVRDLTMSRGTAPASAEISTNIAKRLMPPRLRPAIERERPEALTPAAVLPGDERPPAVLPASGMLVPVLEAPRLAAPRLPLRVGDGTPPSEPLGPRSIEVSSFND